MLLAILFILKVVAQTNIFNNKCNKDNIKKTIKTIYSSCIETESVLLCKAVVINWCITKNNGSMYVTKEKVLQSLFAEYKEIDRCEQCTGHNLAQAVVCITYVHTHRLIYVNM